MNNEDRTDKKNAELLNIHKTYGEGELSFEAVKGISFDLYDGEFVILFGPSGSGKSTLLNIIAGLDEPTEGVVKIENVDIATLTPYEKARFHREKVGMVFQSYNLIPTLSVLQNIALPLVFAGVAKEEREERAHALLTEFGLEELQYRLPPQISGGQQQRIGILRALINKSPLVIADEPTGNLDSKTSETVMSIFSVLCRSVGVTMCIVTHDSSQFHWADRVIHVLDGEIVKQSIFQDKPYYRDLVGNIEYRLAEGSLDMKTADDRAEATRMRGVKKPETKGGKVVLDDLLKNRYSYDIDTARVISILPAVLSHYQIDHMVLADFLYIAQGVRKRIQNIMTTIELEAYLQVPISKGGLGIPLQSARYIVNKVDSLIQVFGYRPKQQQNTVKSQNKGAGSISPFDHLLLQRQHKDALDEKILVLLGFWLSKYQEEHLSEEQIEYIVSGFRHRLKGDFSSQDLFEFLDESHDRGGAGLYVQTARNLTNELEETIRVFVLSK